MRESVPSTLQSKSSEDEENSDEEYQIQELSTTSYASDDSDNDAIVVKNPNNEEVPSFGNVSVMNSNDIHFGNKTIYQGPVTIKQFLYANGENSDLVNDGLSAIKVNGEVPSANGITNNAFLSDKDTSKDSTAKDFTVVDTTAVPVRKSFLLFEKLPHRKLIIGSLIVVLIVAIMTLILTLLLRHSSPVESNNNPEISEEQDLVRIPDYDKYPNLTLSSKLRMVTRIAWVAQPPNHPPTPLKTPVPLVIIHHTASENCSSMGQCILQVRVLQDFHITSREWWDIGYNFLVGGDGSAYEGRGWTSEGAHLLGYNAKSIGIAFIGTFTKIKPPEIQFQACKKLIEQGVEKGYVSKNYKLLAARQLLTTDSPGKPVLEEIMKWPHWSETP